jgi:transketolase
MNHSQLQGKLRTVLLQMHYEANSGHIGCSLSCIDLLLAILKYKDEEDSFILSKGHAASALYVVLNQLGKISDDDLSTYYKEGTKLPAHPAPCKYPSIVFATGSLGHGLPLAVGVAKANKLKKSTNVSYVLMSDGETNEGTTWEAAHFAVAHKLDNLIVIIDKNGLQGYDETKNVLGDTAPKRLWQQIGFEVIESDGHNINLLLDVKRNLTKTKNGKPKLIIAKTTKGKGVAFMENKLEWHYLPINQVLLNEAITQIRKDYQLE